MRKIPFVKMDGLGNDFMIIDERKKSYKLTAENIVRLANRKTGVGYSRPFADVVAEAKDMVAKGAKEIVLLGQNVNAWHGEDENGKASSLDKLIYALAKIEGLYRIRFVTSYPSDMTDELIEAFGKEPKLMPYLHLPIQSGSDKVLKAMNRRYTVQEYSKIIEKLRAVRADIAISSDFIVGFAGENGDI